MTYEPTKQCIAFVLPQEFSKAEVILSCPNFPHEAIHLPVVPGHADRYVVSTANLAKGTWQVYLNWSNQKRWYHREIVIEIR